MKQTIALKLMPSPEQAQALKDTMHAFNSACDYIAGLAFEQGTANKIRLQHLTYYQVREQFGLSSQLTVRAIAKVAECYKRDKKIQPKFRETGAITYDYRLMSFKGLDRVSLLTMQGRVIIPMIFGQYQAERMERIKGQADLVYRDGMFYLYATIDLPEPPQTTPDEFLGVDMGVVNIAVDSDGEVHAGNTINNVRHRQRRLRTKLQKKQTKSAKRLLKKLSGKEARFARHTNHVLSKHIVAKAKDTKRGIAVEDLNGIAKRIRSRKPQRATLHSWSFAQLRAFLEYKAQAAGIPLVAIDPRNTSRTCPSCGCVDKHNRKSQSIFKCVQCNLAGLADHFAALEIGSRAKLTLPNAASLTVHLQNPSALAVGIG